MPDTKRDYHTMKIRRELIDLVNAEVPYLVEDYPGVVTNFPDAVRMLVSEALKARKEAREQQP